MPLIIALTKNTRFKLLMLAAIVFGASLGVRAQACGYSITTIYLRGHDGRAVKEATFKFVDATDDHSEEHFKVVTKTFWDVERNAYVSAHGLCGEHRVVMTVAAAGFETTEQQIALPFERQGFILKLKRKGTDEEVSLEKLPCKTSGECASLAEARPR